MSEIDDSFREWCLEFSRQLEAKGLSKVGDSGQINWPAENPFEGLLVTFSFGDDNERK